MLPYIKAICWHSMLHKKDHTSDMQPMQLITPVQTHVQTIVTFLNVSSWDKRCDRCVRATYSVHSSLQGCCFVPLPLKHWIRFALLFDAFFNIVYQTSYVFWFFLHLNANCHPRDSKAWQIESNTWQKAIENVVAF